MAEPIWMQHARTGETKQVEGTPETIVPLMVAGWAQCPPPAEEAPKAETEHKEG